MSWKLPGIKDPKGTAEYFLRKLNLLEGGTFENCNDCRVDKDGSFIAELFAHVTTIPLHLTSLSTVAVNIDGKIMAFDFWAIWFAVNQS